jgi:hypothetical protein
MNEENHGKSDVFQPAIHVSADLVLPVYGEYTRIHNTECIKYLVVAFVHKVSEGF